MSHFFYMWTSAVLAPFVEKISFVYWLVWKRKEKKNPYKERKVLNFWLGILGDPESAVTELQCVWHNLSYMKCTWLPGRNTSPDTNYTLYYW